MSIVNINISLASEGSRSSIKKSLKAVDVDPSKLIVYSHESLKTAKILDPDKPVICNHGDYCCMVCDCHVNLSIWEQHVKLKRHKWLAEYRDIDSKYEDLNIESDVKFRLKNMKWPIIGLDYIFEMRSCKPGVSVIYNCVLCQMSILSAAVVGQHAIGIKHRLNVLNKVDYEAYKLLQETNLKMKYLEPAIKHLASVLEKRVGRGVVMIKKEKKKSDHTPAQKCHDIDEKDQTVSKESTKSDEKAPGLWKPIGVLEIESSNNSWQNTKKYSPKDYGYCDDDKKSGSNKEKFLADHSRLSNHDDYRRSAHDSQAHADDKLRSDLLKKFNRAQFSEHNSPPSRTIPKRLVLKDKYSSSKLSDDLHDLEARKKHDPETHKAFLGGNVKAKCLEPVITQHAAKLEKQFERRVAKFKQEKPKPSNTLHKRCHDIDEEEQPACKKSTETDKSDDPAPNLWKPIGVLERNCRDESDNSSWQNKKIYYHQHDGSIDDNKRSCSYKDKLSTDQSYSDSSDCDDYTRSAGDSLSHADDNQRSDSLRKYSCAQSPEDNSPSVSPIHKRLVLNKYSPTEFSDARSMDKAPDVWKPVGAVKIDDSDESDSNSWQNKKIYYHPDDGSLVDDYKRSYSYKKKLFTNQPCSRLSDQDDYRQSAVDSLSHADDKGNSDSLKKYSHTQSSKNPLSEKLVLKDKYSPAEFSDVQHNLETCSQDQTMQSSENSVMIPAKGTAQTSKGSENLLDGVSSFMQQLRSLPIGPFLKIVYEKLETCKSLDLSKKDLDLLLAVHVSSQHIIYHNLSPQIRTILKDNLAHKVEDNQQSSDTVTLSSHNSAPVQSSSSQNEQNTQSSQKCTIDAINELVLGSRTVFESPAPSQKVHISTYNSVPTIPASTFHTSASYSTPSQSNNFRPLYENLPPAATKFPLPSYHFPSPVNILSPPGNYTHQLNNHTSSEEASSFFSSYSTYEARTPDSGIPGLSSIEIVTPQNSSEYQYISPLACLNQL